MSLWFFFSLIFVFGYFKLIFIYNLMSTKSFLDFYKIILGNKK